MRRNAGLTRTELLVICAIVLVIAAIAVPGLFSSTRASNERAASTALKTLASAEADFRTNDRDGNGVNDFWTADVKGLHTIAPSGVPIRLINLNVAAADGDDAFHSAGGRNLPLSKFARPQPMVGYWFMSLVSDKSTGTPAERFYKVDTQGTPAMGAVHHPTRFGFVVFPDTSKVGEYIFRVNENNTVYREWIKPREKPGTAGPGFKNVPSWFLEWPSDDELKKHFGCGNFCCRDVDTRR
jgi:type II secretory pathway pseudopilin PulG